MPERDEHYWKYRVFHEPSDDQVPDIDDIGHPVPIKVSYLSEDDGLKEVWQEMDEVEGNFFVLRPDHDHHARVALAAYAMSCSQEWPQLGHDLMALLNAIDWEEQNEEQILGPLAYLKVVRDEGES